MVVVVDWLDFTTVLRYPQCTFFWHNTSSNQIQSIKLLLCQQIEGIEAMLDQDDQGQVSKIRSLTSNKRRIFIKPWLQNMISFVLTQKNKAQNLFLKKLSTASASENVNVSFWILRRILHKSIPDGWTTSCFLLVISWLPRIFGYSPPLGDNITITNPNPPYFNCWWYLVNRLQYLVFILMTQCQDEFRILSGWTQKLSVYQCWFNIVIILFKL